MNEMEDIEVIIEEVETSSVEVVEETTVLVREYKAGKNIAIEDNIIHNTYEYQLPSNVVRDSEYVHTDNNYTTEDKAKLDRLENADLSNYYTKPETDEKITENLGNYYTKNETRTMILQDLESYYTKDEIDDKTAEITAEINTKTAETNNKFANYYTKSEADTKISNSVSSSSANTKAETLNEVADNYYNKTQVENMIASSGGGGTGASTAIEVSIEDVGAYYTADNVEGALQELGLALLGVNEALDVQEVVVS